MATSMTATYIDVLRIESAFQGRLVSIWIDGSRGSVNATTQDAEMLREVASKLITSADYLEAKNGQ